MKPPSMGTTVPVTKRDAGESSQSIAPTRSSGVPKRASGVCSMIFLPRAVSPPVSLSVRRKRFCSVRKKPGMIALTRRCGEYSCAR